MLGAVLFVFCLGLGGCQSRLERGVMAEPSEVVAARWWRGGDGVPERVLERLGSVDASRGVFRGEFVDLEAALDAGLTAGEMAVAGVGASEEGRRLYRLLTIRDEPAWLEVRWGSGGGVVEIELVCAVGWFGRSAAGDRLVSAMGKRLEALAGRGVAGGR